MPAYHFGFDEFNFVSIFGVAAAGLVAATAMLFVLDVIHLLGIAKPEPIHTIGGVITGDTENSFWLGLGAHYATGITFAFVYYALFKMLPVYSLFSLGAAGFFAGMMHGLIVGFMILISVAEHHRDARMRATGIGVVFSYVFAHAVYGAMMGGGLGQLFIRNASSLDLIGALTTATVIFGFNFIVVAIAAYAFWRERLEDRALVTGMHGVLDREESFYRTGRIFPEKMREMPGGDTDPYGYPTEREPRAA